MHRCCTLVVLAAFLVSLAADKVAVVLGSRPKEEPLITLTGTQSEELKEVKYEQSEVAVLTRREEVPVTCKAVDNRKFRFKNFDFEVDLHFSVHDYVEGKSGISCTAKTVNSKARNHGKVALVQTSALKKFQDWARSDSIVSMFGFKWSISDRVAFHEQKEIYPDTVWGPLTAKVNDRDATLKLSNKEHPIITLIGVQSHGPTGVMLPTARHYETQTVKVECKAVDNRKLRWKNFYFEVDLHNDVKKYNKQESSISCTAKKVNSKARDNRKVALVPTQRVIEFQKLFRQQLEADGKSAEKPVFGLIWQMLGKNTAWGPLTAEVDGVPATLKDIKATSPGDLGRRSGPIE